MEGKTAQKKTNRKLCLALAALLVLAAAFVGIWFATRQDAAAGAKHIEVAVDCGDGTTKDFAYDTDAEYLGEVLLDEGLVEGETSAYGLYITAVDGVTADADAQQWWCLTKGGEMLSTGADTTPIADGDAFELTLTTGW